jgi:hypothetical protein
LCRNAASIHHSTTRVRAATSSGPLAWAMEVVWIVKAATAFSKAETRFSTSLSRSSTLRCCPHTDAHRAKYTQKIETHLFIGTKRDLTRIVPNYSAFEERNDSRATLSSSRNAVNFSSACTTKRFPSLHRRSSLTLTYSLPICFTRTGSISDPPKSS